MSLWHGTSPDTSRDSQSSEEGYGTRIGLYRLAVPLLYRYNVSRMAYRKFDVGLQAILEIVSAGSVLGVGVLSRGVVGD